MSQTPMTVVTCQPPVHLPLREQFLGEQATQPTSKTQFLYKKINHAYLIGVCIDTIQQSVPQINLRSIQYNRTGGIESARAIIEVQDGDPNNSEPPNNGTPSWCVCGKCRPIPSQMNKNVAGRNLASLSSLFLKTLFQIVKHYLQLLLAEQMSLQIDQTLAMKGIALQPTVSSPYGRMAIQEEETAGLCYPVPLGPLEISIPVPMEFTLVSQNCNNYVVIQ